jgi:hypothetical protein
MVVCLMALLARAEPPLLSTSEPMPTRARVVIVQDNNATESFRAQHDHVVSLVQSGITKFTGKTNSNEAWQSLAGPQDVIGIKVYSAPGSQVGTRVAIVEGIIEGLLAAGFQSRRLIVWDRRYSDLRRAGFTELAARYGVRVEGSVETGWDTNTFYDSPLLGQLVYGDLEFQKRAEPTSPTPGVPDSHALIIGRKSYVTRLLTKEITKVINVSPLLNHNSVGVSGNLYSLAIGSVDNVLRFEGERGKLAVAVPEIYALPAVGDRVVLSIVDALVCQYQGERLGYLHYSAALNQLRFSKDPVALDSLSLEELSGQRTRTLDQGSTRTNRADLYRNAELLELGIAEPQRIDIEKFNFGGGAASAQSSTNLTKSSASEPVNTVRPPPAE